MMVKANIAIQISPHNKELETAINVQTNTFAQRWRIKALLTSEIKKRISVLILILGLLKCRTLMSATTSFPALTLFD
jgi:hypothetical protein